MSGEVRVRARARWGLVRARGGHQKRREEDMHEEGARCSGVLLAEEGEGPHRDHLDAVSK